MKTYELMLKFYLLKLLKSWLTSHLVWMKSNKLGEILQKVLCAMFNFWNNTIGVFWKFYC